MKPYGIPRIPDVAGADVADIQKFGLSGGGKDYFGNKAKKKSIRRSFKKRARNLFRRKKKIIESTYVDFLEDNSCFTRDS